MPPTMLGAPRSTLKLALVFCTSEPTVSVPTLPAPGRPGLRKPPDWIVTAPAVVPVPAKVAPLATVIAVAASEPVRTSVPT